MNKEDFFRKREHKVERLRSLPDTGIPKEIVDKNADIIEEVLRDARKISDERKT